MNCPVYYKLMQELVPKAKTGPKCLRMYRMYGEKQGWKVTELDWQWGDGAGIKTCTLQFDGPFAGFLKAEMVFTD
jgi:protein subunit release factor B